MSMHEGVSLQISLAPTDLPHARHIVPHQLRQWAGQVNEVLLVVDLHRSRGRFAEGWTERLPGLRALIQDCCAHYPHARSVDVDYSHETRHILSACYFGGNEVPAKDWSGGPFYTYLFGINASRYRYVLHTDSDMLYGGGSSTWVAEAVRLLTERADVLACNPLPGPPTADGHLRSQALQREPFSSPAYRSSGLSTRVFLIDTARLLSRIPRLPLLRPSMLRVWQATVEGNPPYLLPEQILSHAMAENHLVRIDFLGTTPGVWALHPPYRSAQFYERLPELIRQVETGDIPEGQRGYHDLNDSMIDWTSARQPKWMRIMKHAKIALNRPFQHA